MAGRCKPSRCVTVHYPSTKRLKYSNCTVSPSNTAVSNGDLRTYAPIITVKHA